MKTTITETMFKDAFAQADRQDNFSREALGLLFEYLENYEEETGHELDFDVVDICCDFTEGDARDVNDNYGLELDLSDMDDSEAAEAVAEALNEQTSVVGTTSTGAVIFQVF